MTNARRCTRHGHAVRAVRQCHGRREGCPRHRRDRPECGPATTAGPPRPGFGLDSLIEVGSGLVILWQFRHPLPETRERQALRLIAVSFFALAAYVTVESRPVRR